MNIGQIKIGNVDGKEEFFLDGVDGPSFRDIFLMPDNIELEKFASREVYFISGFRGTGKTSLLRFVLGELQSKDKFRSVSLFKSDIPEEKRMSISRYSGAVISERDSRKMGIAQDFKSSWTWFILDRIGKIIIESPDCCDSEAEREEFLRILGLKGSSPYKKVLGFLPKLNGAKVSIGADLQFFSTKLDLEFEKENATHGSASFTEVVDLAIEALGRLEFKERLVLGVDELEVFFISTEQYQRDLCMVRDLIFSVDRLNRAFRSAHQDIILLAAIRREVVDAIGPLGQEVTRVVHDRGVNLSWHHGQRSLRHPLINLIRKKIKASLPNGYMGDPITDFFDDRIDGEPLDAFLLDRSFYRPRDIMWRLTFAQKAFPKRAKFDSHALERFSFSLNRNGIPILGFV